MTDAFRAELEKRIVDLARVRQFYPAELSWQLQLWSADEVEVHDLVADLRQETDNPPSGPSRSSRHDDSHLELPSIVLQFELGTPVGGPCDSRIKIADDHCTDVRCEASRTSGCVIRQVRRSPSRTGCLLTGTGIVPAESFSHRPGDVVTIDKRR
jgi:hypothetical protein